MKIFWRIFGMLLLLLSNLSWAQEYQSIQEILADTTSRRKIIPVILMSRAINESDQIIQEISEELVVPLDLLSMDSVLAGIRDRVEESEKIFTEEYFDETEFLRVNIEIPGLDSYLSDLEEINDRIENRIKNLENENSRLKKLLTVWQNTREEEWFSELSQVMLEQINILDKKAREVQEELIGTINNYLESQIQVNSLKGRIENLREALREKEADQDKNIMSRSTEPLWDIIRSAGKNRVLKTDIKKILQLRMHELAVFYQYDRNKIYLSIIFFILAQIFFYHLKQLALKTDLIGDLDKKQNNAFRLLQSNWATGTVLSLLVVSITLTDKPVIVSNLLYLISLFPLYVLFRHLVDKKLNFLVRFLFVIFFLTIISELFFEYIILRRIHFAVLNILTLIWLIYLIRKEWLGIFESRFLLRTVWLISRIFIVLLVLSLFANLWGSFNFTVFITFAISKSLFYGLLIYLLFLILVGIATSLLFSKPSGRFRIIMKYRTEFTERIVRVLKILATISYIALFIDSYEILDDVYDLFMGIIGFGLSIGDFSFAIGDIILFVIVMFVSVWISDFIVFILTEQSYDKTGKRKDLVASVSALVKFAIITTGFLLGIVAIGFELDKLTILLSAFGVGIGFGLQNIFNNLVSGIIIVFEKPLQVGDVIEVGQLIGEVKKIGIRSSIVRTYDGSEVIVPNGNLISNELINWTHSDMNRRLIVKVGVEYGTNPDKVLELLTKVAGENPDIMSKPKPYALFTEFGDSSLNFELRCWTDNFDDWLMIISKLRVQVNQALKDAGITIPFPQRDVHLYSDNPVKIEDISIKPEKKK